PQSASEMAHAALISPVDLPGAGWTIRGDDQFIDFAGMKGATCADVSSLLSHSAHGIAGRAQRPLEQPTRVYLAGVIVMVEVDVYDNQNLGDLSDRYRQLAKDGSLATCIGNSFD